MRDKKKPLIVISSCLMGQLVRYNKGHCQDSWVLNELSKVVDFYPICPEVEMGLGVPREEIHLYFDKENPKDIKLKMKHTGTDLTDLAKETNSHLNKQLEKLDVDGFILTKKSPSCGFDGVKTVQKDNNQQVKQSPGIFGKNIIKSFPNIPRIDSGRLNNKQLRENFLKQVFANFRFQHLDEKKSSIQKYHQQYKYILMDHSPAAVKHLGKIAANFNESEEQRESYYSKLIETLRIEPTVGKRFNTIQHLMGYFKTNISSEEKKEVSVLLGDYKEGIINHLVLLRYIKLLASKYSENYLVNQYYFFPSSSP